MFNKEELEQIKDSIEKAIDFYDVDYYDVLDKVKQLLREEGE